MESNKNQLREETIDFAIAVSDVCDDIKGCSVFVNQLLRCSSSTLTRDMLLRRTAP